jgi:putative flavoprotein involved in K+ transport
VTQVHSAHYRNPQALPDGPVLVVGGGNSGFQIAEELAATRQLDLAVAERVPMLPQRLAGKDLFWWLTRLGLLRVTVASRLGRRASRREFIIGTNRRRLRTAGYRSDYSWIHIPGVVREGLPIHRRGVTEVPGLYFLGLTWRHTRGSALLGFVHDDAAHLATASPPASKPPRRPTGGVTWEPST